MIAALGEVDEGTNRIGEGDVTNLPPKARDLFDEEMSNWDASLRVKMRAEIAGLHQRRG